MLIRPQMFMRSRISVYRMPAAACPVCGATLIQRRKEGNWMFRRRIYCSKPCAMTMLWAKPRSEKQLGQAKNLALSYAFKKGHKPSYTGKGLPGHWRGRKHSTQSKRRMSEAKLCLIREGKFVPWNKGGTVPQLRGNSWNRGRRHTVEEISRIIERTPRGPRSHNWKGGVTPMMELFRNSSKYKRWRRKVIAQDGGICQNPSCLGQESRLEAHHIIPVWQLVKKYGIKSSIEARDCDAFWDPENGITYCQKCHLALPSESRSLV